MLNGAEYPVLRIFASWPGEAELDRTIGWSEANQGSAIDADQHPLAALHLENFVKFSTALDQRWFRRDVEEKIVMPLKRAHEEDLDSIASRVGKRSRRSL